MCKHETMCSGRSTLWCLVLLTLFGQLLAWRDETEDYGELTEGAADYPWSLADLLPPRETRKHGNRILKYWCSGRLCMGVCCGGKQCCKKGWKCRFMSNTRHYRCIP